VAFEQLNKIVDELDQIGLENIVANELLKFLREGKRYFKTEYQRHCQDEENQCPDHCRKFSLSDPNDPDFQELCAHQHMLCYPQCDYITPCLNKVHQIVKDGKTLSFYSKDQQDDLLYDITKASDAIVQWKESGIRKARCPRKAGPELMSS